MLQINDLGAIVCLFLIGNLWGFSEKFVYLLCEEKFVKCGLVEVG